MILFVCTGNTCRSPMAEALAKVIFTESKVNETFASRGISAHEHDFASSFAVNAVKAYGASLSAHRAAKIKGVDLLEADLVLTMTDMHKTSLQKSFPSHKNKIFTLKEYVWDVQGNINDPFGGSQQDYNFCAEELYACISALASKCKGIFEFKNPITSGLNIDE